MVFMALWDIRAGEQHFYSYCDTEQSASKCKAAELTPYGIAQCICSSCVNATLETDTIRETYSAQLKEYKQQSLTWERGKVPAGTIDELLRYQRAMVKEGFDTEVDYWAYFLLVLIKAYQRSGKTHESTRLVQELLRRRDFMVAKEAIEKSG
jgi:disulfide oxidoreductase YuzD